jgi:hypothetical protein
MGGRAAGKHYPEVVLKPLLVALALAFCTDARAQAPFAALSVSPAPAVSPARAAAAAPPLPFRYIGRMRANGKLEVLLMRGTKVYSIGRGGEIDGEYRVDRITESTISFTYLPLKTKQDMNL